MDEDHPAEQKKSRWWTTSRGAMRITVVLIAVGALLFVFRDYYLKHLVQRPLTVLGAATAVAAVVVLIRVGQQYQWTGFGESVQTKPDNQEIQPRKTLWDWLQLFIVPLALAAIGLWFSAQQDAHQQQIEEKRAQSERQIEEQRAQDAALQAYLDQMSQLMLNGNLRDSEEDSEVRTLARARTQTVLGRLDGRRKGSVVQFLYEADLINKEHTVVSLSDVRLHGAELGHLDVSAADLSGAILRSANMSGADLSDANLSESDSIEADLSFATISGANMSGADLIDANLSESDSIEADLSGADLSGANLSGAVLRGADLSETYLIETDLSDTDLSDAKLSDAIIRDVNLRGANLRDARGATNEQLEEQAKTLEDTTMPDGSIHH
jgi:uncharacterized protein YjbI with pentapeptide repeats